MKILVAISGEQAGFSVHVKNRIDPVFWVCELKIVPEVPWPLSLPCSPDNRDVEFVGVKTPNR